MILHFTYKGIVSTQPYKNAVLSTSSIMLVMTMLQTGARNDTKTQMMNVLKLKNINKETILDGVRDTLRILKGVCNSLKLNIVSKVYPKFQTHIVHEFIETMTKHFGCEIKCLDYITKPEESRLEMNNWVEEETSGKIKDLLTPGAVTSATMMLGVNAIYFKGQWNEQFSTSVTRKADFHITKTRKIETEMMGKTFDKIKYTESKVLACKALELPYIGRELGMVIVLPDDTEGLPYMEENLSATVLTDLMRTMCEQKIVVNLPKFKQESLYELKGVLSSLGMSYLFDRNKADLSGIGANLYVTQVIPKAFIDVNEEGTEAAAATSVVIAPACCLPTILIADRPFLFIIWDHRISAPLFIGRLTDPEN